MELQSKSGEYVLSRLAELATEFGAGQIADSARSVAERVSEGRFFVACVGQFKRGKSTLLNALIGQAVLPTGVVPVTAVPAIIRYGKPPAARVRVGDAAWRDIGLNAIQEYVSEEKNPENSKHVAGLEIFIPHPLLSGGMCLVDTPGLGSVFAGNTAATNAFIPHIDAAIILLGADPPLSGDELQLVETVAAQVHDLLFVLNKSDRVSEIERAEAVEFTQRMLTKRLGTETVKVFEISAFEQLELQQANRDWLQLVGALEDLVRHSGRTLVHEATERGIRRASDQLLSIVNEERETLLRPLEESEQRIARLRETLEDAEGTMQDLGVLLAAEQQRLSGVFVDRRNNFLKQAQAKAVKALRSRIGSTNHKHNGPKYRREINHLAQEIARQQLLPWLEGEAQFAEEAFQNIAERFTELGNNFLYRLGETGIVRLDNLPEELSRDQGLRARSQFHFHLIERVAAPASPFLFVWDLILGGLGLRNGIVVDAEEFLDQLLEVNSSRVQSDVDERVRESRQKLDSEIKNVLREALAVAERALRRARAAQEAGAPAINAALIRIEIVEREVRSLGLDIHIPA